MTAQERTAIRRSVKTPSMRRRGFVEGNVGPVHPAAAPASIPLVSVDINPATVTKLADRGSIQTVGIVTDAEPFLRALVNDLGL